MTYIYIYRCRFIDINLYTMIYIFNLHFLKKISHIRHVLGESPTQKIVSVSGISDEANKLQASGSTIQQVSSVQNPGWLFDIGEIILPNYMGIIISQYKDPYKPISIMEGHKGFERCWSAIVDSEVSMSLCVASQHHFTPVAFGEILTPKPNKNHGHLQCLTLQCLVAP